MDNTFIKIGIIFDFIILALGIYLKLPVIGLIIALMVVNLLCYITHIAVNIDKEKL